MRACEREGLLFTYIVDGAQFLSDAAAAAGFDHLIGAVTGAKQLEASAQHVGTQLAHIRGAIPAKVLPWDVKQHKHTPV